MKLFYPSTARNREPILEVLRRVLPARCTMLEVASGSGEHAVFFATALPGLVVQPSDPEPQARASVDAWRGEQLADGHADVAARIRGALDLDVSLDGWHTAVGDAVDAVLAVNMIHIAPWQACVGLFRGSAALLGKGAPLVLYGPYRQDDVVTAPSNEAFDAQLRARDPGFGLRRLQDVSAVADDAGFALAEVVSMPSNNLTVVFRRR
jgi:hypothetical protein